MSEDPREKHARPPHPSQQQAPPGLESEMAPKPDSGEGSFKGSGKLRGKLDVEIVGVDLVKMFHRLDPALSRLRVVEASLSTWLPDRPFNLITCVHGLHYVGHKLSLVSRAAYWLVEGGQFVANLDLHNLKFADGKPAGRRVAADLRRSGLEYDRRRRRIICRGRMIVNLPYVYMGADDRAGPNDTGQPAVDSYYEGVVGPSR